MSRLRTNFFNQEFFDIIDTENKAYWLGFISADGWVSISSDSHRKHEVGIELKEQDIEHLEKFCRDISYQHPKLYSKKDKKTVGVRINSIHMVESLGRNGITPNKSLTIKPNLNIATELQHHYWRGIFDGDGSICLHGSPIQYRVCLYGTSYVLEGFRDFVGKSGHMYKPGNSYALQYSGIRQSIFILENLYSRSNIHLDRKYDKYRYIASMSSKHKESVGI